MELVLPESCARKDNEKCALQKELEALKKIAEANLTSVKREFSTTVIQLEEEK